jgi:hypothetical protein
MAIDEGKRHELHERARQTLGDDAGDSLMELLPPVGWADVATKRDLEVLQIGLTSAINDSVRGSEHRILVWMFTTVLTAVLGGTAISVAVALAA